MKIALILADMERTVNIKPCCCLSLASQPHSVLKCRSLSVQHFSKFLQHPVARAKTVPSNQIAEGFEFCWLTKLTLLQPEVAKTWKSAVLACVPILKVTGAAEWNGAGSQNYCCL